MAAVTDDHKFGGIKRRVSVLWLQRADVWSTVLCSFHSTVTTRFLTISTFHRPKTPSSIFKASTVDPPLFLDLLPSLREDACDYIGPTWVFQAHHPIAEALITPAMFLSPGEIT